MTSSKEEDTLKGVKSRIAALVMQLFQGTIETMGALARTWEKLRRQNLEDLGTA